MEGPLNTARYTLIVFVTLLIRQASCNKCGNRYHAPQSFSGLLNVDVKRYLSSYSVCQSVCEFNQSCAAVSYNRTTSVCIMSGEPDVTDYPENGGEKLAIIKESHFEKLKIYEFSRNLTAGAVMKLSSRYDLHLYNGYDAIDGIYLPSAHDLDYRDSVVATMIELSPWIQADLHTNHYILGVEIWDRSESTPEMNDRLANVSVAVGESDANFDDPPEDEICNYLPGQPPADQFLVTCHTRMYGRYVRVTAVEINHYFNIYEMEIHGFLVVD